MGSNRRRLRRRATGLGRGRLESDSLPIGMNCEPEQPVIGELSQSDHVPCSSSVGVRICLFITKVARSFLFVLFLGRYDREAI